jgi:VanZ family protein
MVAHALVRKTAHLVGYAVLAVLAARAFYTSSLQWLQGRWFVSAAILLVAYAMIDEYHQSLVPTRTGTVVDVLIYIFGGLVALVLFRALKTGDRRPKVATVSEAREIFRAD